MHALARKDRNSATLTIDLWMQARACAPIAGMPGSISILEIRLKKQPQHGRELLPESCFHCIDCLYQGGV
jgi:hypothetical protein